MPRPDPLATVEPWPGYSRRKGPPDGGKNKTPEIFKRVHTGKNAPQYLTESTGPPLKSNVRKSYPVY